MLQILPCVTQAQSNPPTVQALGLLCESKVIYNPGELAGLAFLISQGLLIEVVDGVPVALE